MLRLEVQKGGGFGVVIISEQVRSKKLVLFFVFAPNGTKAGLKGLFNVALGA